MRLFQLPVLMLMALAPTALAAQPIDESRISFPAGATGTTLKGRIAGEQITDYLLNARAGQSMTIDFAPSNASGYFNLMIGNDPAAIHVGSTSGNHYKGVLPKDGDYRIRVYLMRNAARRGEAADFTLKVAIGAAASATEAAPAPDPAGGDFADGLSGGPDWWQVTGVAAHDTLNVRAGPGTSNGVIGKLANGDRVRNRGCSMNGETRWCHVEMPGDQPLSGWVAGRYLAEAGAPAAAPGPEAHGSIPCALASGQPMGSCSFRASRGTGGTASIWIALPGGGERYLDFREGRLVGSDPGTTVSHMREADLNMILVDGHERYEIPDAVLYGG
ncbi:SH3 domain-containing protein [Paracoccus sp. MBLB3053]|uniref:SH3 domain-containing protein n=1 Tax=Paracoccus aurantius TaxID=3073814 RepID=A0ABU2HY64_9RHOB|nr:SH3 domain-containing protein [Paracoccus sp. MBLB3053]MDS9469998.1 SH3 domain-containing protein [Paracoccus sp. MBLB3053]